MNSYLWKNSSLILVFSYIYICRARLKLIYPLPIGYFAFFCCCLLLQIILKSTFLKNSFSVLKTVWIQIRPNILSCLIWVPTVCSISYQQTTLVGRVNPYYAEYFKVLHSSPIFILLACSIPVVSMCFHTEWKTVWILIRWLHQK